MYTHRNRESLSQKAALNKTDFNWCLMRSADSTERRCVGSFKTELFLQWPTNRKSYMVYRMLPFSMTLFGTNSVTLRTGSQGNAIIWCWISQKRYEIHSFNGILIGTYTRPTQGCHFEWSWVTLRHIQWHEMSRGLSAAAQLLVIIIINVKKLWFIHELTAHHTSKTAKITKRWLPTSTSPKCQCAVE